MSGISHDKKRSMYNRFAAIDIHKVHIVFKKALCNALHAYVVVGIIVVAFVQPRMQRRAICLLPIHDHK